MSSSSSFASSVLAACPPCSSAAGRVDRVARATSAVTSALSSLAEMAAADTSASKESISSALNKASSAVDVLSKISGSANYGLLFGHPFNSPSMKLSDENSYYRYMVAVDSSDARYSKLTPVIEADEIAGMHYTRFSGNFCVLLNTILTTTPHELTSKFSFSLIKFLLIIIIIIILDC